MGKTVNNATETTTSLFEEQLVCRNCIHYLFNLCHVFLEERDPEEEPLKPGCFEAD